MKYLLIILLISNSCRNSSFEKNANLINGNTDIEKVNVINSELVENDTTEIQNLPSWFISNVVNNLYEPIFSKDSLSQMNDKDFSFFSLDINGDDKMEFVIIKGIEILIFYKDGKVESKNSFKGNAEYEIKVKDMQPTKISYWFVDDNFEMNEFKNKLAKGDILVYLEDGAGSINIYYDGENYKYFVYD